jgi:hypothetical protein
MRRERPILPFPLKDVDIIDKFGLTEDFRRFSPGYAPAWISEKRPEEAGLGKGVVRTVPPEKTRG